MEEAKHADLEQDVDLSVKLAMTYQTLQAFEKASALSSVQDMLISAPHHPINCRKGAVFAQRGHADPCLCLTVELFAFSFIPQNTRRQMKAERAKLCALREQGL